MVKKVIPHGIFYLMILFSALLFGCANIVPPSGGKKDLTPPKLLSESPKDSVLNQQVYQVTLHFNKFMEVHKLEKYLSTSPLLPTTPVVTAIGKKVIVKLPDSSLKPNTTYRIFLGNALTDNREQTPYTNFTYLFSTGNYFDSLKLKGTVTDAATGLPDSTATIFLYPATDKDSAVIHKRPEYVRKVQQDGSFELENLPKRTFKVFAVSDEDNNFLYTPGQEKIDFYNHTVTPVAHPDSSLDFAVFKEVSDDTSQIPKHKSNANKSRFGKNSKVEREKLSKLEYSVEADTANKKTGTFDLAKPLRVDLFRKVSKIDSNRIYLSYDNKGIDVEALHTLRTDSSGILIQTEWLPDKVYTLRLIKGWATDTGNVELRPGEFSFHTRSLEDYATLNIHMDSAFVGKKYLLVLSKDGNEIWKKTALNSKITIPLLSPGEYTLHLIIDENLNGKWDTGNFFAHKHAETVIPYKGEIVLKAGWVNDIDFKKSIPENQNKENRFFKEKSSAKQKK